VFFVVVQFGLFHFRLQPLGVASSKSQYQREYAAFLRQLKQTREAAGISQVQLAARLGQTQSSVSKIERGERRVDIVELRAICDGLGVPLLAFIRHLQRDWNT
jgi:ribosome-binding protein aMBF1 (putative translation factor)